MVDLLRAGRDRVAEADVDLDRQTGADDHGVEREPNPVALVVRACGDGAER